MGLKMIVTVAALAVAPGLAQAKCSYSLTETAETCAPGTIWDEKTELCLPGTSS